MTSGLDNVTFQVVKNSLISAAEEMKIVLAKTAYSPLLKLAGDYSCGIFDVDGNMVAKGRTSPSTSAPCPIRFAPFSVFLARWPPVTSSSTTTPISAAPTSPM